MLPAVVLKKMVMGNFEKNETDADIADSIDFMVEKVKDFLYLKRLQILIFFLLETVCKQISVINIIVVVFTFMLPGFCQSAQHFDIVQIPKIYKS